ncbi:MAG TPA: hypothetical protein VN516_02625 [Candidatus Baltobacteraceae bacterium]|nr:hypothetical protein [Candidatus Baltobacteraceae bacterium]
MTRVSKIKRTIKRSPLFHLLRTISPMNQVNSKVDAWGGAIVVAIAVSGVFLMRTLLAAQ